MATSSYKETGVALWQRASCISCGEDTDMTNDQSGKLTCNKKACWQIVLAMVGMQLRSNLLQSISMLAGLFSTANLFLTLDARTGHPVSEFVLTPGMDTLARAPAPMTM